MTVRNDPSAMILDPKDSRFLVLGATGLLGRHIARECAGRSWPVTAMRRWNSEADCLDFPGIEVVVGDIFESASLAEALAGVNGVFYCVAPEEDTAPREVLRRSVEGIRRVLDACRKFEVDRLVLTSSATTIARGAPGWRATEEEYYLPGTTDDPFVEAKYAVELEAMRYIADGFDVVITNPTLLVGPGVDLSAYARLGVDERQPMNVIDVREAARVHAEAMLHGRRGARYILGGTNTTVGQVFDGWSSRGRNENRPREAYLVESGQWVDCSRARQELGLATPG